MGPYCTVSSGELRQYARALSVATPSRARATVAGRTELCSGWYETVKHCASTGSGFGVIGCEVARQAVTRESTNSPRGFARRLGRRESEALSIVRSISLIEAWRHGEKAPAWSDRLRISADPGCTEVHGARGIHPHRIHSHPLREASIG